MFRGIIDTPQGEGRRIQIAVFILPYYLNEWRFNSAPRHIIFFINMIIWAMYIAMAIAVVIVFINEVRDYIKMWREWDED